MKVKNSEVEKGREEYIRVHGLTKSNASPAFIWEVGFNEGVEWAKRFMEIDFDEDKYE